MRSARRQGRRAWLGVVTANAKATASETVRTATAVALTDSSVLRVGHLGDGLSQSNATFLGGAFEFSRAESRKFPLRA